MIGDVRQPSNVWISGIRWLGLHQLGYAVAPSVGWVREVSLDGHRGFHGWDCTWRGSGVFAIECAGWRCQTAGAFNCVVLGMGARWLRVLAGWSRSEMGAFVFNCLALSDVFCR